jgi:NADH-quinone oxidoreductase subunit J
MKEVLFYLFAGLLLLFSILTVSSRKILRAAVFLLFSLVLTAALYFLWDYLFMASVQLMLYAGGIMVLIVFSVLLTHNIDHKFDPMEFKKIIFSALLSLVGAVTVIYVILSHPFKTSTLAAAPISPEDIGRGFLSYGENGYILPFEVISILLLAAMIGAIVIAKKTTK